MERSSDLVCVSATLAIARSQPFGCRVTSSKGHAWYLSLPGIRTIATYPRGCATQCQHVTNTLGAGKKPVPSNESIRSSSRDPCTVRIGTICDCRSSYCSRGIGEFAISYSLKCSDTQVYLSGSRRVNIANIGRGPSAAADTGPYSRAPTNYGLVLTCEVEFGPTPSKRFSFTTPAPSRIITNRSASTFSTRSRLPFGSGWRTCWQTR